MSVTELNAVTGTGLAHSGGWSTDTAVAHSGANALFTASAGETITGTNITFRSLYLLLATRKSGAVFDLSIDGGTAVRHRVGNSFYAGDTAMGYRTLHPGQRANPTDGSHGFTLTTVSGTLYVNSVLPITGAKMAATTGQLTSVGDSYTIGTGASQASLYYANVLQMLMQRRLGRTITLTSLATSAIGSERLWAFDATHVGGMYRAFSVVAAAVPEFLTYLFGYNDVVAAFARPADMFWHYYVTLCFLEDLLDVTSTVKVAVCTPPYVSAAVLALAEPGLNASAGPYDSIADQYAAAVKAVRKAVSLFNWCKLADINRAFDGRQSLMVPNSSGDFGVHPNDGGHALIGHTIDHTFAGIAA